MEPAKREPLMHQAVALHAETMGAIFNYRRLRRGRRLGGTTKGALGK